MVGNWVDAADGLEVQGDGSELTFTYLHVADDSMKVAAKKMKYKHTTILQGDVGTGGVINLGSYGTADSQGSYVEGVYVHRITQKPFSCNKGIGYCGASLVAAPTCEFGRDVTGIEVNSLQVNNLSSNINSVNRPFNIGLGDTRGIGSCGGDAKTDVTNLMFKDFSISVNPLTNSTFFDRGKLGGAINNINFFDGKVNANVAGKVAIHEYGDDFAYFICGPKVSALGCWNTNGVGSNANSTVKNVTYSSGTFSNINFPYTP